MSSCITLTLLVVTVFGHFAFGADPTTRSADCSASLNWLRSQIVPNRQVPTPHPQRRGLILSYAPGQGQKGPLYDKSFVYDAAAGAIALVVASDWGNAAKILDALVRVQREDGSFWFSYSSRNDWPNEIDHDMAVVRTGATSWAGYALCFYLQNRSEVANAITARQRQRYLVAARRAADFISRQRANEPPLARGLLKGGQGVVKVHRHTDKKKVVEIYQDRSVLWVSTEHNISSYFFLTALYQLTQEPRYGTRAAEVSDRLMAVLWQPDVGQFATGLKEDGTLNGDRALDCASWGALFLLARGEKEKAKIAIETADRVYANEDCGVRGHRPYHAEPIYEDPGVQQLLLPKRPEATWKDLPFVWSEGSLGVALAHLRLGNITRANEIVNEMEKLKEGDGIKYATRDLPYIFSAGASVAGTAWHVILKEAFTDPRAKGFWNP